MTKIELKASDIEEFEQKKQELTVGDVSGQVSVASEKKSKTQRINERIGYDPRPVADDGNPHICLRNP